MSQSEAPRPNQTDTPPGKRLTVAGIGASAGGLAALEAFFDALPDEPGMAFVVVTHMDPDHESLLPELLQRHTPLPVRQVRALTAIQANHVYVIPPARRILVTDTHLETDAFPEPRGHRAPIDDFFRSLAAAHPDAIALILSGGGTDGAVGIKNVKEQGGLLLVQDPDEAEYQSMPRAAIATGLVDLVLPVAELARRLVDYSNNGVRHPNGDHLTEQEQDQVQQVLDQVEAHTGHDFHQYKRATVTRRIRRRMQLHGLATLDDYLALLRLDADEPLALFNDLLIRVTRFFRDREAWTALAEQVIPRLFENKDRNETVRVWSVGCATGEEAYSLAMLLLEHRDGLGSHPTARPRPVVFATDVDERALQTAREGLYPAAIEADLSAERLARFFVKEGDHYHVRRELRDVVIFARHSVLRDPPFSRLDLISSRNLLIYLDQDLQEKVLQICHYALAPNRYLFLGKAESTGPTDNLFTAVDSVHGLYRTQPMRGDHRRLPPLPLAGGRKRSLGTVPSVAPQPAPARPTAILQHAGLLEETAPPSVLIDAAHQILHISETAGRYLRQPGGAMTKDLLQLVRPELHAELRAALFQALEHERSVLTQPIPVRFNGGDADPRPVSLAVRPRRGDENEEERAGERLALVFFLEDERPRAAGTAPSGPPAAVPSLEQEALVAELQAENRRLRERLGGTAAAFRRNDEKLKAANEELQSLNEEYRSTAEELETSKEELQSVNEELKTVNAELKSKLDVVSRTNSDLENLVVATGIATLFLDRELHIRRYTPAAAELFNIIPGDRGRPIGDLTGELDYETLEQDARAVLRTLIPIELEVQSSDGRWLLARLRPYRAAQERIDGVVASFVNITKLKNAEMALRESEERQAFLLRLSDALRPLAGARAIQATASRLLGEHLGASRTLYAEIEGPEGAEEGAMRAQHVLAGAPMPERVAYAPFGAAVIDAMRRGETIVITDVATDPGLDDDVRAAYRAFDIAAAVAVNLVKRGRWVAAFGVHSATPRSYTPDEINLVREVADRTWAAAERARAEEALRAGEARYRALFESMDEGFFRIQVIFDADDRPVDLLYLEANPAATRMVGADWTGRRLAEISPEFEPHWYEIFGRVALTREPVRMERYAAPLNTWYSFYVFPVGDPQDRQVANVFQDITERKGAEEALRQTVERRRFLLELNDALTPLTSVPAVEATATRLLARQLDADRACYALYDPPTATWTIRRDYAAAGLDSLAGTYPWEEMAALTHPVRDGALAVITDVAGDELLPEPERARLLEVEIGALIMVPLLKDDALLGVFLAAQRDPREWTADDIITAREVAERTWQAIERARVALELRQSETRLRLAQEAAGVGTFEWNIQTNVNTWSAELERLYGLPPGGFGGTYEAWAALVHPNDLQAAEARVQEALSSGRFNAEWRAVRPDGTIFWVLARGWVEIDERGEPQRMIGANVDITSRIRAEAALRESEQRYRALAATLEERVQEQTLQVHQLASELSLAEQEERDRIGRILHDELQQQLYAVQLQLALLQDAFLEQDAAAFDAQFHELVQELNHAIATTRQLNVDLSPAILHDEGLMEAIGWLVAQMAEQYGLEVTVEAGSSFPIADKGLRVLLFQAVRELLFNVVKHAGARRALVHLEQEDHRVRINVYDRGRGFDVGALTDERARGSGLTTIHHRLRLVGGELQIHSDRREGTRVTIVAPLVLDAG